MADEKAARKQRAGTSGDEACVAPVDSGDDSLVPSRKVVVSKGVAALAKV